MTEFFNNKDLEDLDDMLLPESTDLLDLPDDFGTDYGEPEIELSLEETD